MEIIDYLTDPHLMPAPYLQIFTIIRMLAIILSLLLLGIIIFILTRTAWLKYRIVEDATEFVKFKSHISDKYAKEWKKLLKKLDSDIEAEYKLAIMEADNMLDSVLQNMGYTEETIEKKLIKITSIEISNIEELKEARKIRNSVIHDPNYQLSKEKAKEIIDVYAESLKCLGLF